MGRLRFMDRVRSWFGAKVEPSESGARPTAKRCALEPVDGAVRFAQPAAGAVTARAGAPVEPATSPQPAAVPSGARLPSDIKAGLARAPDARIDPLDPPWAECLEDLPRSIADSAALASAAGNSLRQMSAELDGHRHTSRVIADAVSRLPNLAEEQTQLAIETNKILQRHTALLESVIDGLTGLRSALRSVDESSRRHVLALGQLEQCHRQVLFEYQTILQRAYRRVGLLAVAALILVAWSLGAIAYVAWRVLVTP